MKIFHILFLFLTFELCLLTLDRKPAEALDMSSDYFKIELGNFNLKTGSNSSSSYQITGSVGQTITGQFDSTGYILKTGYPYIPDIQSFTFSISTTKIDFGDLSPNRPMVKSAQMVIQNSLGGYEILAGEKGELKSSQNTIPDTTCAESASVCTPEKASAWTNPSVYGFGFGLTGKSIPSDFRNSSYFRPFSNFEKDPNPVVIMSSSQNKESMQTTINFKLNTSFNQPFGNYHTVISLIALPGY